MDPQLSATRAQHRLVTAIAVPLALTLFIVAALTLMVVRLAQLNRDVAAIERSISLAHHVERLMIDAETGLRGYLLVDGVDFLEPTINADRELPARLAELRASVTGRPDQLARVDRLEQTFQQWRRLAETELEAKRGGGQYLEIVASRRPKWLMDDIRRETDAFVQSGHEAQAMRTAEVTRFTRASVAAIVACGVALTAAMWLVSRRRVLGVIDLYAHALDETGRQAAELREAAATLERRVSERTRELQQTNEELEAFS
jgi:CHASE3 domain sensor protein